MAPVSMKRHLLVWMLVLLVWNIPFPVSAASKGRKPNVIFILTDNQGDWQLGCYGNPDFKTPNIDRMASEGVRFSNAFANNAVCSPTRATFLTGLTPSQHGVHRYLSAGRLQIGPLAQYTLEEYTTLPEVLHGEGYVCGLSGKWHLGDNLNPQDGFSFWVTKAHGHSQGFLNQEVLEDGKTKVIEKHLSEYWTDRGIEFIEKNRDKPFFLYLAYNGPYSLSGAMKEKVPSPWSDPYVDHPLPSFPRPEKIHPWQRNQHDLIGNVEIGRNLAGQVTAVDAGVGRILETLKRLDLDEDTIVIYAADQGAVAGHAGFWGMGDHTKPLHGRDGTTRIPMIFRWPGKISKGRVEDHVVTNYDFMPSVLGLLGLPMPDKPLKSPGRDFSPTLLGRSVQQWDDTLFYEFENVRSIRTRDWKYVERLGEEPTRELFSLGQDPDELNNLASEKGQADRMEQLSGRLHAWFEKNSDPRWDLWKGGQSRTRIGTIAAFRSVLGPEAAKTFPPDPPRKKSTPVPAPSASPRKEGSVITPEKDHSLALGVEQAVVDGESPRVNPSVKALAWWKTRNDRAMWMLRKVKPGKYVVFIEWAADDACAGQEFLISNQDGSAQLTSKVASSGGWGKFKLASIGEIFLPRSSINLSLSPVEKIRGSDLFDLRRILLIPEGASRLDQMDAFRVEPSGSKLAPRADVDGNEPRPVFASKDGVLTLLPSTASLHGPGMNLQKGNGSLEGWKMPSHAAVWSLKAVREGRYDIHVEWAMPDVERRQQQSVRFSLDGNSLKTAPIRTTGGRDRFARFVLGSVDLPAGDHDFGFGPKGEAGEWVRLRSLRLVPADTGDFRVPPLKVPDGFEIRPVATPPLLKHPMLACVDDRGRMFISESAGINAKAPELLEKRPHQILMLEDEDRDGVFDKSTVFAKDMVLPNGAQWHDGALYVCSPPYIWRLEDRDGDGRAEVQEPINGKFGFNGMSSAFHGPVLGPDGRLYWCGGQHGWTLGDTTPGFDLSGPWPSRAPGVFSSWPDGSNSIDIAHGGLANPMEVAFSPEGEPFGTVAVYDNFNGRHDAVLFWLHGAKYNLNRGRGAELPQTSDPLLPPVSRRGWVAPAGITRLRSGALGEAYRNNLFLCEFNTHRVYRLKVEREGAGFRSSDEVFLESSSPYTHFTDVFEDADGSLFVVDTGGWFLYGCPTSSIEKPEVRGAIYRISRKGASSPYDPYGMSLRQEKRKTEDLVMYLNDPRPVVQDWVIQELSKRGDEVLESLREVLKRKDESARRNALWVLTRIHSESARAMVRDAMDDESFSVRLVAAKSIGTHRDAKVVSILMDHLGSDQPAVRRECAVALGRIGNVDAVPSLLEGLVEAGDRFLRHSLIFALIELGDAEATRRGWAHESAGVREGTLIALDQMKDGRLTAEEVAPHVASLDPSLREQAIRIATERKWSGPIAGYLKSLLDSGESAGSLEDIIVAFSGVPEIQDLVGKSLVKRETTPEVLTAVLSALTRVRPKNVPDSWRQGIAKALDHEQASVKRVAVEVVADYQLKELAPRLTELLEDSRQERSLRLGVASVLSKWKKPLPDPVFDVLADSLRPSVQVGERVIAARSLAAGDLGAGQARRLVPLMEQAGSLEMVPLLEAISKTGDVASGRAMMNRLAMATSLPGLEPGQVETAAARYEDAQVSRLATQLVARLRKTHDEMEGRLAELESGLLDGNPDRGRAAFQKAACAVCHAVRGEGGLVGPDLTSIGSIRTTRDLLEAIVFPSATFAREYEPMNVSLKDGEILTGRVASEDEAGVHVVNVAGQTQVIPRSDIEEIQAATMSLMPAGLEQALSNEELSDLIAYLLTLREG